MWHEDLVEPPATILIVSLGSQNELGTRHTCTSQNSTYVYVERHVPLRDPRKFMISRAAWTQTSGHASTLLSRGLIRVASSYWLKGFAHR